MVNLYQLAQQPPPSVQSAVPNTATQQETTQQANSPSPQAYVNLYQLAQQQGVKDVMYPVGMMGSSSPLAAPTASPTDTTQPAAQPPGLVDQVLGSSVGTADQAMLQEVKKLSMGLGNSAAILAGSPDLAAYFKSKEDNAVSTLDSLSQQHPTATMIGQAAGGLGAGVLATPAGIPGAVLGGALAGLATADATSKQQVLMSGLIGGGLGALGGAAANVIGKTVQGVKFMNTPQDVLSNISTAALNNAVGKDAAGITPDGIVSAINSVSKDVKAQSDANYAARNALADQLGLSVNRVNFTQALGDLTTEVKSGAPAGLNAAINKGQTLLGDNSPISYQKAQDLLSSLRTDAHDAAKANNNTESRYLYQIADKFEADTSPDGLNEALQALHQNATAYYRDVVAPINQLSLDKVVVNDLTDHKMIATFVKKALGTPTYRDALAKGDPNTVNQLMAAQVNAFKEAATDPNANTVNLLRFSKALGNSIQQNPTIYGDAGPQLQVLAQTLAGASNLQKKLGGIGETVTRSLGAIAGHTLAGALGPVAGPVVGAVAAGYVPKAMFAYGASKLLDNPAASALLNSARILSKYPDASLTVEVNDRVTSAFANQFKNLPPRFARALLATAPSAMLSGPLSQQSTAP